MNMEDPVYSKQALDMFTVANEFCIFIEGAENQSNRYVFNYLAKVLPLLYIKGILLPSVIVEYPEANERYVTEENWQDIFNNLRRIFSTEDVFLNQNPQQLMQNNVRETSLAENLTDIYQDMKDFVLLFGKESHAARENALHDIKKLFADHWGHRLIEAHRYIHYLIYTEEIHNSESLSDY